MSRRGWLTAGGAALLLTACGCLAIRPHAERGNEGALADSPPLSAPSVPAKSGVTRAQKPDAQFSAEPGNERNAVCRLLTLPVDKPAEAAHANPTARIRAVVNGELILDDEVHLACQMSPPLLQRMAAARTQEQLETVLKQGVEDLIDREVVLNEFLFQLKSHGKQGEAVLGTIQKITNEAFEKQMLRPMLKSKHLATQAELAAELRHKGASLELVRRWWQRNFMMQQYLASRLDAQMNHIGHTEVSEYYNEHRDEYTQVDSVDWQDIFLDAGHYASRAAARQFAEALVGRIRQGEDFAQLSHEFDNGESGKWRKGAGQGHKHGEIFPIEAEPLLFKMREGDTEILDCPHGFHIIRLVKRQYAGAIPFDAKVQKEIHDKLRNIIFQRERESIIKKLKQKAVIDRCD